MAMQGSGYRCDRAAACCGEQQQQQQTGGGFKAPLQRPDAPQWRAAGIADSAGDKSKSECARGTASVVALNQTSAHKEDL